jgi:DNA-binding response OmpR family regulator
MPEPIQLLLVEDEPSLALIIVDSLEREGFAVRHYTQAEPALKYYYQARPDLLILDVMLPKSNGYEIAKTIRNTDQKTPILFLTAKSKAKDVVTGFKAGGNDYLKKPFGIEELVVRIQVLLNDQRLLLKQDDNTHVFQIGQYTFDSNQQTLQLGSRQQSLTGRETALLKLFCEHQNSLLPKKSILLEIWGDDSFFNSRSMDVFISKLRKHLSEDPAVQIINVRGAGYKLVVG